MFKWQTSVAIAITISLFHCLADKWNPTPRPMPTQSQSIWQHDARERGRESGINRDDESKNASLAEWKPKRLSSCLTYTTCRNYSGIFGPWPLEQPGIDCQWCAAPFPYFFTQPMPCHKSIRAKFLAKALKALQKAQFFLVLPAMLSCLCHVEQKQLPALPVASFACGYGSSVRVAYTPRGTHAKDIVGKWMNGKLKAIFCLSRDGSMYVPCLVVPTVVVVVVVVVVRVWILHVRIAWSLRLAFDCSPLTMPPESNVTKQIYLHCQLIYMQPARGHIEPSKTHTYTCI